MKMSTILDTWLWSWPSTLLLDIIAFLLLDTFIRIFFFLDWHKYWSPFPPLNKNLLFSLNWKFLFNSEFFLRIAWYKKKLWDKNSTFFLANANANYKVQFWGGERLLCSQNCKFISHNSDLITHNCSIVIKSHLYLYIYKNSEKYVRIVSLCLAVLTCEFISHNSVKEVTIATLFLRIASHITNTNFITHNCEFKSRNSKKSQNCPFIPCNSKLSFAIARSHNYEGKKVRIARCKLGNTFFIFIQWWKQASMHKYFCKLSDKVFLRLERKKEIFNF